MSNTDAQIFENPPPSSILILIKTESLFLWCFFITLLINHGRLEHTFVGYSKFLMIFVSFSLRRWPSLLNSKNVSSWWLFCCIIIKSFFSIPFWDSVANLISRSRILVFELLRPKSCCIPGQSADENRAFFTSSSFFFFFGWSSRVTGQSEVFRSRHAACWRVDGLEMLTSFSTFVFLEFLHFTAVWLEPSAIVEKQFKQMFVWPGTGFDFGWPHLRFFLW